MCRHNICTQILSTHLLLYSCLDFCVVDSVRRYVYSYNSRPTLKNILSFHTKLNPRYKWVRLTYLYSAMKICGLKKIKIIYIYAVNQQMHIDKVWFIVF